MDLRKLMNDETQTIENSERNNREKEKKKPMSKRDKIINLVGWIIILLVVIKACGFMFSDDDKTANDSSAGIETQEETETVTDDSSKEPEEDNGYSKYGMNGVSAQTVMSTLEETYRMPIDSDPTNPSISHSGVYTTDYSSGNGIGLGYEIDVEKGTDAIVYMKVSIKSEEYQYFEDVIKLISQNEASSNQVIEWLNENKEKVDSDNYSYSASTSASGIDYIFEVRNFTDSQLITLEMWSTSYHEKVRASA